MLLLELQHLIANTPNLDTNLDTNPRHREAAGPSPTYAKGWEASHQQRSQPDGASLRPAPLITHFYVFFNHF